MNYVVLARDLPSGCRQELPFVFPEDVPHTDMVAVLSALFHGVDARVVAAGEVFFGDVPHCFGRSNPLDKVSRERLDGYLIRFHDFRHGLVGNDQTKEPDNG